MVPGFPSPVSVEMIGQTVLIGIICAVASIIVMLAVALSERCFQRLTIMDGFLRPVLGGALLGGLALLTPTVLGAGPNQNSTTNLIQLALLIVLRRGPSSYGRADGVGRARLARRRS
jgi:H+/Cl- antiporter ClcA